MITANITEYVRIAEMFTNKIVEVVVPISPDKLLTLGNIERGLTESYNLVLPSDVFGITVDIKFVKASADTIDLDDSDN